MFKKNHSALWLCLYRLVIINYQVFNNSDNYHFYSNNKCMYMNITQIENELCTCFLYISITACVINMYAHLIIQKVHFFSSPLYCNMSRKLPFLAHLGFAYRILGRLQNYLTFFEYICFTKYSTRIKSILMFLQFL